MKVTAAEMTLKLTQGHQQWSVARAYTTSS